MDELYEKSNSISDSDLEYVIKQPNFHKFSLENTETIKVINDADKGINLSEAYDNVNDLMKALDDET